MKSQRHYKTNRRVKFIATFLLVIFLNSICFPSLSWALTGVHQTEYTSYETAQNSDMVDLITGDFNYTVPLLNIPGPEGGFSMPLAYHGGIELDEEASWVGLGWSFNPGAIVRDVNQYPDDFDGQIASTQIFDVGGNGYSINFILGNYTYDSKKGKGGSIGLGNLLSLGFGTQLGLSAVGVTYDANKNSASVDPMGVAMAALTIASMGTGELATIAEGSANGLGYFELGKSLTYTGSTSTNINDWHTESKNYLFYQKYNYYLDVTKNEKMYGSLYYGKMSSNGDVQQSSIHSQAVKVFNGTIPSASSYSAYSANFYFNNGSTHVSSDMYANLNSLDPVEYQIYSTNITYDSYNVMGGDVTGNIEPYRLDEGFLALPLVSTAGGKYALSTFSQTGVGNDKVDFRYLGDRANNYQHHLGQQQLSSSYLYNNTTLGVQLTNVIDGNNDSYPSFLLTDPVIYDPNNRIENDRTDGSYQNGKLVKPRHIKWFTNSELGYSGTPNTIGGYEITSKEGMTYHYKLPVYNKYQLSHSMTTYPNFNRTSIDEDYPITWLLTSITGSDYIDRGQQGVTDDDWGYWVNFDYGKVSDNFTYRQPYYGLSVTNIAQPDVFNLGQRESYYLNTIRTRTHTALFLKDIRKDGRSARQNSVANANISSALKLNEIILLTNTDFNELTTSINLLKNSGNNQNLANGDNLSQVYDVYDLSNTINQYIKDHQVSKIKFNYKDYNNSLCSKTLNSFNNPNSPPAVGGNENLGKLTLESISMMGRNDYKTMPDYLFEYNTPNPDYNFWKKDAYGMYQASNLTGQDLFSRKSKIPNPTTKGDEWCLNKIITPLGGEILVNYERDDYSSVSGHQAKMKFILDIDYSDSGVLKSYYKDIDFNDYFTIGQQIEVYAEVNFNCDYQFTGQTPANFPITQIITAVSQNSIHINNPPTEPTPDPGEILGGDDHCANSTLKANGYIIFNMDNKKGGQNRVKTLTVKDEVGNEYSTEYRYTLDGLENGKSSGVIAKEPSGVIGESHIFYSYYDFPNTPIMYSKVNVLKGKSPTTVETVKSVYEFGTPHYSMVAKEYEQVFDGTVPFFTPGTDHFKLYNFNLHINKSQIGQLKSIKHYDRNQLLDSKIEYGYSVTNENQLGFHSEGSFIARRSPVGPVRFYNLFRTTKYNSSNVLSSVTVTNDGQKKEIRNTEFDKISGDVLETEYEDAWGNKFKSKMIPAYKKYPEMGSKYVNDSYKNMMSQPAAEYLYTWDKNLNIWEVVSASIITWSDDWNYREFDGNTNKYVIIPYTNEVWRKKKQYAWKADIDSKGTYKNSGTDQFEDFDWTESLLNPHWKKLSEITLYDHFSNPIESKDVVGKYIGTKFGYDNSYNIASAPNSKYIDFGFSGAEDKVVNGHFGGEVLKGVGSNIYDATINGGKYVHTGTKSLSVTDGSFAFVFRNYDYDNTRKYKASVWVHEDNAIEACLKVIILDAIGGNPFQYLQKTVTASTPKAGEWYLLEIDIPEQTIYPAAQFMEVQAFNPTTNYGNNSPIYFDDFIIRPSTSPIISNVYDEKTGLITSIIDNNGMAVRYEYDDAGRLVKSYKEVLNKGFVKTAEYQYNYGRQ